MTMAVIAIVGVGAVLVALEFEGIFWLFGEFHFVLPPYVKTVAAWTIGITLVVILGFSVFVLVLDLVKHLFGDFGEPLAADADCNWGGEAGEAKALNQVDAVAEHQPVGSPPVKTHTPRKRKKRH